MKITKNDDAVNAVLAIAGRLDSSTAPEFEKAADELVGSGADTLVLDFSELVYTSSAGLRVILKLQKAMSKRGGMKLRGVSDDIKEIFDITGFLDILDIE